MQQRINQTMNEMNNSECMYNENECHESQDVKSQSEVLLDICSIAFIKDNK